METLTLKVSARTKDRLKNCQDLGGHPGVTEVLRHALYYYETLLVHQESGGSTTLHHVDGSIERVTLGQRLTP